jgi:hypothetical protein
MSYIDTILNHYTAAGAELRKRLAAVLAEAETAQAAAPKPVAKSTGTGPASKSAAAKGGSAGRAVSSGAMASEDDPGDAVAELLRLAEDITRRSPTISLESAARVALYGNADLRRRIRETPTSDRMPRGAKAAAHYLEPPAVLPADVQLAAAADALVLSEGIPYGVAMDKALADDSDLADRYASRHVDGAPEAELPSVPVPRGYRLITKPADVELAERAEARATADRCELGDAMTLVLNEDPALASRYFDASSGWSALHEVAQRAEQVQDAARGREHIPQHKAVSMVLAEDPVLKDAYYCHLERI